LSVLEQIHKSEIQKVEKPDWTVGTRPLDTQGVLADQARTYLTGRGISLILAEQLDFRIGLEGKAFGYIIIPIHEDGEVKNFLGRSFMGSRQRYTGPHADENYAPKSHLLYGFDRIIDHVVLVEGVFDALALWEYNAVALMGKEMSYNQLVKIINRVKSVSILLDSGCEKETKQIAKKLLGFVEVKISTMPVGAKDASSDTTTAIQILKEAKDFYLE
jgi:hypothetical protein